MSWFPYVLQRCRSHLWQNSKSGGKSEFGTNPCLRKDWNCEVWGKAAPLQFSPGGFHHLKSGEMYKKNVRMSWHMWNKVQKTPNSLLFTHLVLEVFAAPSKYSTAKGIFTFLQ